MTKAFYNRNLFMTMLKIGDNDDDDDVHEVNEELEGDDNNYLLTNGRLLFNISILSYLPLIEIKSK